MIYLTAPVYLLLEYLQMTRMFLSQHVTLKSLEQQINTELKKVKIWCDTNKLSINFSKTNFMIVKSPRKKDLAVNIKIEGEDGTSYLLERKDRVKYLGVFLDDTASFKHHMSYVASRISRSNGVIAKLRHFLTLSQMRQLYYSIINPYIAYAILAWGSAYKSYIKKIQTKQNHAIRLIFFARTSGKQTDSALSLLNLLWCSNSK